VSLASHPRRSPFSLCPQSHSHFGSHPTVMPAKIAPFFSCTYVERILQPLCFQIHACNGGCTPLLGVCTFRLRTFPRVSELFPLFSYSYALFCTHQNHNSFVFKRFRTLCAKHPGVGGGACPSPAEGFAFAGKNFLLRTGD